MAVTRYQKFGQWQEAVWVTPTSGKAEVKTTDGTSAVVTYVTPVDETGAVITGGSGPVLASKGYQQITGLTTAQPLTVPTGATLALITTEGQSVRWRDDGTNPTATVGQQLLVGQTLVYDSTSIAALRFIQTAATAILDVSYYG